jgi:tetratricopeptide (TPR) repeat protein
MGTLLLCWLLGQAPPDFDPSEFEGPDENEREVPGLVEDFDEPSTPPLPEASAPEAPVDSAPRRAPAGRGSLAVADADAPEAELPEVEPSGPEVVTEAAIQERLQARADALARGDFEAAEIALQELIEVKRSLGIRNMLVAANLVVREAQIALQQDQVDLAVERARAATRLAPDLPAAHWMEMSALFRQDFTQVVQLSSAFVDLLVAWTTAFRNAVSFWGWVLGAVMLGLGGLIVAYAALQVFKYLAYPAYDISQRIPGVLGMGELTLALLVLVALPVALGFGLWVSVALGLAAVLPYQSVGERAITAVFGLCLAATPLALHQFGAFILFHGSDTDVLAAALGESLPMRERERLEALSEETEPGQRRLLAQVRAYRARQAGNLQEAKRQYERVLELAPDDPQSLNNWAVLAFLDEEEQEARGAFERAAEKSRLVEPRLNLSLLLADEGKFEEADALLLEARRLDPGLTAEFTEGDGARTSAQRLLEVPLPDALLWSHLGDQEPAVEEDLLTELWTPIGGRTRVAWYPLVVGLLAIGGLLGLRVRGRLSTPCKKCGRPAARTKQPICEQCVSVFVTAVAVEPKIRLEKEAEVRSHQRRRRWTERLLGPLGLGLVWNDRPVQGVLFAFGVLTGAAALLLLPLLGVSAWRVYVGPEARQAAVFAIGSAMVFLSGWGLLKSWER